jgi:hypothetical protein
MNRQVRGHTPSHVHFEISVSILTKPTCEDNLSALSNDLFGNVFDDLMYF